ncbi:DNA glycosylase [Xylariaceae sp. FL0662B]|nr:DNA glycosylase [Xylariaceae sp. FL0662B]
MPRRGRKTPAVPVRGGWDVLPHNMGFAPGKGNTQAKPSQISTQEPSPTSLIQESLLASDQSTSNGTTTNAIEGMTAQNNRAPETVLKSEASMPLNPDSGLVHDEKVQLQAEDATEKPNQRQLRARKANVHYTESPNVSAIIPESASVAANGEQQGRRQLRPRKEKAKLEESTEVTITSGPTVEEHDATKVPMKRKRKTKTSSHADGEELDSETVEPKPKQARRKARKTKDNPYGLTPGETPFPEWQAPSAEQCEEVYDILADMHDDLPSQAPQVIPAPSLEVTGCGEVPSVLDALIRTLLSGATTFENSSKMLKGLIERFGILEEGIGKGSINWNNVRSSTLQDVAGAIHAGGLANIKAKYIKAILDLVHQENMERREAYLAEKETGVQADVFGAAEKTEGQKKLEILKADQNRLSLDHMHGLSASEAMKQFTKYPGIGVKTAACVILFCLQRPCFAVDTHVDKMSKWLGWAPEKATEDDVFSHLEVRCPDGLKYGLHQLFIRHGQTCAKCQKSTVEGTDKWKKLVCPLDHLLVRFDKRQSKAKPKLPKKKGDSLDSVEAAMDRAEQKESEVKQEEHEQEIESAGFGDIAEVEPDGFELEDDDPDDSDYEA